MAKQNIYDNDSFFENFKNLRNNKINFNDCIETPILLAMIPEVDGKRVLDIGCGMGQHAKQYSDMGAESVLGIDISEKMLEYAKEHFHAKNITYRQMALEDICQIDEQFDLITSSLASAIRLLRLLRLKWADFCLRRHHAENAEKEEAGTVFLPQ